MAKVSLPQGVLIGGKAKSINGLEYNEFLGVPYAKPPVGELRFKSPQPAEPWIGERDATKINTNNISCQLDFGTHSFFGSEDCLYLNVFTPQLPSSGIKPLPVMVYLHEGGFVFGSGIDKNSCGPDFLIENNVVVVTINYRLSVFGFLSLENPEVAGNMGLKDQVKALEWVKQNIKYFNGDNNNVTIFGTSAGAVSVDYLLLSPTANGLFHKAISHSGSILNSWAVNKKPAKTLEQLLHHLKYNGLTDDKKEIYEFLMNTSAEKIILANSKIIANTNHLEFGFGPIIENDYDNGQAFITEDPYIILKKGNFNKVPTLKGFCDKEVSLRTMIGNNAVEKLVKNKNFLEYFPFEIKEKEPFNSKLIKYYLNGKQSEDEISKAVMNFLSDLDIVSGIWISGKMLCNANVPLYIYEFTYVGELNSSRLMQLDVDGAGHGDIVGYLFSTQMTEVINESDALMVKKITHMWTNFARSSNPTPETNDTIPVHWPMFSNKSLEYLNIDKRLKVKTSYESEKMDIFEEIYKKYLDCS